MTSIDVSQVPNLSGIAEKVEQAATGLGKPAAAVQQAGNRANAIWSGGGLRTFYKAPEAARLLAAMGPVKAETDTIASQTGEVVGALREYAAEVRKIQSQLSALTAEAVHFNQTYMADPDADTDDKVQDKRNHIIKSLGAWTIAFQEAQRDCASRINALVGGPHYVPIEMKEDGYGRLPPGYVAWGWSTYHDGMKLPWGQTTKKPDPWWQRFIKGAGSAAYDLVHGPFTLIDITEPDRMAHGWTNLYHLARGLCPATWVEAGFGDKDARKSLGAWRDLGKGLIAWDDWKHHNYAGALGKIAVNGLTLGISELKLGKASKLGDLRGGRILRVTERLGNLPMEGLGRLAAGTVGRIADLGRFAGPAGKRPSLAALHHYLKEKFGLGTRPAHGGEDGIPGVGKTQVGHEAKPVGHPGETSPPGGHAPGESGGKEAHVPPGKGEGGPHDGHPASEGPEGGDGAPSQSPNHTGETGRHNEQGHERAPRDGLPDEKERQRLERADQLEKSLRSGGLTDEQIGHLRGSHSRTGDEWQRLASALRQGFSNKVIKVRDLHVDALRFAVDGARTPRSIAYRYEYYKSLFDEVKRRVDVALRTKQLDLDGKSKAYHYVQEFERIDVPESLRRDLEEIRQARPHDEVTIDPRLDEIGKLAGVREHAGEIGMGDRTSAAYHAHKHYDELPASERSGNLIRDYLDSEARTLRTGKMVSREVEADGTQRILYIRKVDGGYMEALVLIRPDGKVVVATYGEVKIYQGDLSKL